jgi:hypothetical protein
MPQSELQCPFCQRTSPRPQGLASHIRNAHAKQYPKWLKTPTRLADAQSVATAPKAAKPKQQRPPKQTRSVVRPPGQEAPVEAPAPPAPEPTNPALDLLKQAHDQLMERKQSIEADLARMADLTRELEAVNTQIEALDKTLGVF